VQSEGTNPSADELTRALRSMDIEIATGYARGRTQPISVTPPSYKKPRPRIQPSAGLQAAFLA
jgi:hypothetical protein